MKKKAYFFMMDAIFAVVILTIGYLLISSTKYAGTSELPLSINAENAIDLLSAVKINELCSSTLPGDCICSNSKLKELCNSGDIKNADETLLDYFGELYYLDKMDMARELFMNITLEKELVRHTVFGVEFAIDKETIYLKGSSKDASEELISSKKIIFGSYEVPINGTFVIWGPYIAEINVWKK